MSTSSQPVYLVFFFAVFIAFTQLAQAGQNGNFEYADGHWVGKSEWSSAHDFESCMIAVHNDLDELLVIRLERSGSMTIAVFEKRWMNAAMKDLSVSAFADHEPLFTGHGLLYAPDALAFEPSSPATARELLRTAKLLSVTANGLSSVFALSGSDAAIGYLEDCVGRGSSSPRPITWLVN